MLAAKSMPDLWIDEGRAYSVVTAHDATERLRRAGLSHPDAMKFAEGLWRDGEVAVVMHVIGDKSYEVDRYPIR
jgi:hypothetical protein